MCYIFSALIVNIGT